MPTAPLRRSNPAVAPHTSTTNSVRMGSGMWTVKAVSARSGHQATVPVTISTGSWRMATSLVFDSPSSTADPFSLGVTGGGEHMALTDKQRRHLERRLREERGQIGRILDRYQDEQSASERERSGDVSSFPTHPADEGTDTYDAEVEGSLATRATEELHEIDAALERLYRDPKRFGVCVQTV